MLMVLPEVSLMASSRPDAIQITNRDLQAILDSLSEGIVTLDDEGTVIDINRAACEILEIQKEEAVRAGCPCLLGEDLCAPGSELRNSIQQRRPIREYEVAITTPSGKRKTITLRTEVLRNSNGQALGGVTIFRDISEVAALRRHLRERYQLHNIVGKSKQMQDVFNLLEEVADSDATVLIEGESGTGKELVARACHYLSARASGPFIAVNCSALAESLLESELFGHVRGAFTGAIRDKTGRFESANGGSIFLDEIGEIPPSIQVKLLRVLQERAVDRVGGDKPMPVDIRVIAATNRSLSKFVASGGFRQDLYYRLRVVPFLLPPLRERRDDIPVLAQHFIERFREKTKRPIDGLDESALALMLDYGWPGNVRELENAMEYAFVKARRGLIRSVHLPPELNAACVGPASVLGLVVPQMLRRTRRADLTPELLRQALERTGWNVAKTARHLNTTRNTVYERMGEFRLQPPSE
jgi:PAS domain S-box-containing protein